MSLESQLKNKFFGIPVWIILAGIAIFAYSQGYLDPYLGQDSGEVTTGSMAPSASGTFQLDNAFVNVTAASTALASTSYSFNENTNTVTIPLDVSATDDGTNSTFVMSGRSTAGTVTELLNFTENNRVASTPNTDQSVEFTIYMTNSYLSGLASTQAVDDAAVSATVSPQYFTSGSSKYYCVELRADGTPEIEVDSTDDSKLYSWTTATATKTVPVTFSIPWTTVNAMDEYSDSFNVVITAENADDSPLTVQFIRNDAIIA